ncbi:MAG TPA: glycoside hydrolase family 31 protein, partial [bacterium]|nr:glycoside hydrolase family 31 protein [bacterium]
QYQRLYLLRQTGPCWHSHTPFLLVPEVHGVTLAGKPQAEILFQNRERATWRLSADLAGQARGRLENEFYLLPERIVCLAKYFLSTSHGLAFWNLFGSGSRLSPDKIFAYLGEHIREGTGREFTAHNVEFSTASHNWTYCPLSPRVLLKKGRITAVLGGTSPAHDYGLEVKLADGQVEHFRFNYGGRRNPFPAPGYEAVRSPRVQIVFTGETSWHQANSQFTRSMIDDGVMSPRRYRVEEKRWFRPWYCTWGDQMLLSRARLQQDLSQQTKYSSIKQVLSEDWVVKTARLIRGHKLNIGTIIIDDGWQDFRGDWNLNTKRFPRMRQMVDYLHQLGFQVVLWWAPFILEKEAVNFREGRLTAGPDPYGENVMDYSLPETQQWLERKIRLWFGSGADGWNIDGLKLDFFVEKVTPSTQRGQPDWRGEETGLYRLVKQLYCLASEYHPCPGIIAAPHCPSLLPYLVSVFLEER